MQAMPDTHLWDLLSERNLVSENATNEAAIAKMSQAEYEAWRANSDSQELDASKPVEDMTQKEFELWRKRGGGGTPNW